MIAFIRRHVPPMLGLILALIDAVVVIAWVHP